MGHLDFHGAGATNVFGADFNQHGNVSVYVVCGGAGDRGGDRGILRGMSGSVCVCGCVGVGGVWWWCWWGGGGGVGVEIDGR